MAAEGQSDRMEPDVEVCMKQRSLNSSMQKKVAPSDIHQCLLNIYGDQTVNASTVRWWVVHFSSGSSDVNISHIPDGHTQLSHHEMKISST